MKSWGFNSPIPDWPKEGALESSKMGGRSSRVVDITAVNENQKIPGSPPWPVQSFFKEGLQKDPNITYNIAPKCSESPTPKKLKLTFLQMGL